MLSLLVVCLGAFAQGITGMGFGLLCAPFLIEAYGPIEGVRQVVFLSLILNSIFLVSDFQHVRIRDAFGLLLPALVVVPVFTVLLRHHEISILLIVAGGLTTLSAAVLALGLRWSRLRGPVGALGAGLVSAAMNVSAGLAGPAVAMYAVNASWPLPTVRPTLQLYGLVLNIITLFSLGLPAIRWPLLIGLAGGVLMSLLLARQLPQQRVRQAILALAAFGGVLVVLRGLG